LADEVGSTDVALAALTMQAKVLQKLIQKGTLTALEANTIVTQIGDEAAPGSHARTLIRQALANVFRNARFH
jgi:hypothetical protein